MNMNKWYGYLLTNHSIQVKRYFDQKDLDEARSSDFVAHVYGPFDALNREDAIKQVERIASKMGDIQ